MTTNTIFTNRLFAIYWSVVLFIVVFLIYKSPMKPTDYKNFIFLISGSVSILLFGVSKMDKGLFLSVLPLILLGVFNQHQFLAGRPFFLLLFMLTGFGVLFQFIERWDADLDHVIKTALGLACLLQCAWVALNYSGFEPYEMITGTRKVFLKTGKPIDIVPIEGSLCHWMYTASFIVMTAPFALYISRWLIIPCLVAAFMLPSGIPPVAIVCMTYFALLCRYYKTRTFWVSSALLLVVALFFIKPTGVLEPSERIVIWKTVVTDFVKNPFIGHGLGYFGDFFARAYQGKFIERHIHPHNSFIGIYSAFGLIGLSLLIYWIYRALISWKKDFYAALSIVGFVVAALFGFPLHMASLSLVAIIALACLINKAERGTHAF